MRRINSLIIDIYNDYREVSSMFSLNDYLLLREAAFKENGIIYENKPLEQPSEACFQTPISPIEKHENITTANQQLEFVTPTPNEPTSAIKKKKSNLALMKSIKG